MLTFSKFESVGHFHSSLAGQPQTETCVVYAHAHTVLISPFFGSYMYLYNVMYVLSLWAMIKQSKWYIYCIGHILVKLANNSFT